MTWPTDPSAAQRAAGELRAAALAAGVRDDRVDHTIALLDLSGLPVAVNGAIDSVAARRLVESSAPPEFLRADRTGDLAQRVAATRSEMERHLGIPATPAGDAA